MEPAHGFPLVVYIHGGAWMSGDSQRSGAFVDFPGVLASLAQRGYVVASIEYRLSGEAKFPACIQDVKSAIRWLRAHAAEYAIDPTRAITWGVSAGGHLAALAAVSCGAQALEPPSAADNNPGNPDAKAAPNASPQVSDCVQGTVAWYGVFDFATIAAQARDDRAMSRDVPDAPEWRMLGCFAAECKDGQIAAASPVTYVDPKDPPMLLMVGNKDKTVPYHQTLEMAQKLKSAGVPAELIVLPDIDHGFIGPTAEQTRAANLKALSATFDFIDKVLKPNPTDR
jgi:acetyl esterase/lipase